MSDESVSPSSHPMMSGVASLWWLPLVRGIMMVILGAYALFRPGMTAEAFAQVFGFFLAFDGVLSIIAGITGQTESRGWTILRGVLCLLAGGLIFVAPMMFAAFTGVTMIYIIAFSAIAAGIIEVIAAIRDRKEIQGEGWLVLGGVISIIFGLALLSQPLLALKLFVQVAGAFAIIGGIASIFFAFRLRGFGKKLEAHDARLAGADAESE